MSYNSSEAQNLISNELENDIDVKLECKYVTLEEKMCSLIKSALQRQCDQEKQCNELQILS